MQRFEFMPQEAPKDVFYFSTRDQGVVAFDLAKRQALWRGKVAGFSDRMVLSTSGIRNGVLYDWEENSVFAVRLAAPAEGSTDLAVLWKVPAGTGKVFRQMVLDPAEVVEPEIRDLIEDAPLIRNAGGKDDIECRDAVRGHKQE